MVLEGLLGGGVVVVVVGEKREADEEGGEDTEERLGVDIGWCAPVLGEDSAEAEVHLGGEGGGEGVVGVFVLFVLGGGEMGFGDEG